MSYPDRLLDHASQIAKSLASATASRRVLLFVKATVTLTILTVLMHRIDLPRVIANLQDASLPGLILTVLVLFLSYGLGGWRWALIVRAMGHAVEGAALVAVFWAGAAVAQVVPSPLSDGIRIIFASEAGVNLRVSAVSSILERAMMIVSLMALVAVTSPLVLPAPLWPPFRIAAISLCLLAGSVATAALVARRFFAMRSTVWRESLRGLATDLRSTMRPRNVMPIVCSALASHSNLILAGLILGAAMHLPLAPAIYAGAIPLAILGSVLPVSIGGWGVREGILVLVLVPLGVSETDALGYSLSFGLCIVVSSMPGLVLMSRSVRRAVIPVRSKGLRTP